MSISAFITMPKSRPTRARGLKLLSEPKVFPDIRVAPHAGAWIETLFGKPKALPRKVAPHAGAWIETCGRS